MQELDLEKLNMNCYEACPWCEREVMLNYVVQYCPSCGESITACNACCVDEVVGLGCDGCTDGSNFIRTLEEAEERARAEKVWPHKKFVYAIEGVHKGYTIDDREMQKCINDAVTGIVAQAGITRRQVTQVMYELTNEHIANVSTEVLFNEFVEKLTVLAAVGYSQCLHSAYRNLTDKQFKELKERANADCIHYRHRK